MQTLAASLLPPAACFILFAALVLSRRILHGDPAIQPTDVAKMAAVISHVLPLLVACLAYTWVIHARLGIWAEFAAIAGVMGAITLSGARYRKAAHLR